MPILRAAAIYFALVFAIGFLLGAVRVTFLVPRLGERTAELLELPIMVLATTLVARRRQRQTAAFTPRQQLAVGGIAFALLLTAEFSLGFVLSGRTPVESALAHDPVSGAVYYLALVWFALAPWFWSRR